MTSKVCWLTTKLFLTLTSRNYIQKHVFCLPDLEAKGIAIISVLLRDTLPRDHTRDWVEIKQATLILKQAPDISSEGAQALEAEQ